MHKLQIIQRVAGNRKYLILFLPCNLTNAFPFPSLIQPTCAMLPGGYALILFSFRIVSIH